MPTLIKVLEQYFEEHINNNSNNSNETWENARDSWVERTIDEYLEAEGYMAKRLGALGGKARAKNLSKKDLSVIGKKGALKRWGK